MLSAGTRLHDRYLVTGIISRGGMGVVYHATDENLGTRVAVKELGHENLTSEEMQMATEQFLLEGEILASLEHPGLPRVYDYFEQDGCHYLVMDCIEGRTLEQVCRESNAPLSEARVTEIGIALADILDYLHHHDPPVIYRDLKPANVMLRDDGQFKLIDFGISKRHSPETGTALFAKGAGTPGYAPPEQYTMDSGGYRRALGSLCPGGHPVYAPHPGDPRPGHGPMDGRGPARASPAPATHPVARPRAGRAQAARAETRAAIWLGARGEGRSPLLAGGTPGKAQGIPGPDPSPPHCRPRQRPWPRPRAQPCCTGDDTLTPAVTTRPCSSGERDSAEAPHGPGSRVAGLGQPQEGLPPPAPGSGASTHAIPSAPCWPTWSPPPLPRISTRWPAGS